MSTIIITKYSVSNTAPTPGLLDTGEFAYSSATTTQGKTFVIDHPTKSDKYLVHACLEGPEGGVYYRGESFIPCGLDTAVITLPNYVDSIATKFTINVSPIGEPRPLGVSRVKNGKFCVYGKPGEFFWTVYAKRCSIEVEPFKKDVSIHGEGPYRWIQ